MGKFTGTVQVGASALELAGGGYLAYTTYNIIKTLDPLSQLFWSSTLAGTTILGLLNLNFGINEYSKTPEETKPQRTDSDAVLLSLCEQVFALYLMLGGVYFKHLERTGKILSPAFEALTIPLMVLAGIFFLSALSNCKKAQSQRNLSAYESPQQPTRRTGRRPSQLILSPEKESTKYTESKYRRFSNPALSDSQQTLDTDTASSTTANARVLASTPFFTPRSGASGTLRTSQSTPYLSNTQNAQLSETSASVATSPSPQPSPSTDNGENNGSTPERALRSGNLP